MGASDNVDFSGDGSTSGLEKLIEHLSISDLLSLRARIDKKLPATELSDLNLEKETVIHFMTVKEVMNKAMDDEDTPANQLAQLMNTCSASITQMAKIQLDLYSAERVKKIEQAVIETLKEAGDDFIEKFFDRYEELLESLSNGS